MKSHLSMTMEAAGKLIRWHCTIFAALVADYIEFYPVTNYLSGQIVAYYSHETFNGGGAKFAYLATSYADSVVMVLDPRKHVSRCAVEQVESADYPGFQKELQGPKDCCSADGRKPPDDVLGGEALVHLLDHANYGTPRHR